MRVQNVTGPPRQVRFDFRTFADRRNETLSLRRHLQLSHEDALELDLLPVQHRHRIHVLLDRRSVQLNAGEEPARTRVRQRLCLECGVGVDFPPLADRSADTDISAPRVNFVRKSLFIPASVITSISRSTDCTPIWSPALAPEMVIGAGALQPLATRQVAKPLPCRAPTMKPPLRMAGTTATQRARLTTGFATRPGTLREAPLPHPGDPQLHFQRRFGRIGRRLRLRTGACREGQHEKERSADCHFVSLRRSPWNMAEAIRGRT